jgi:heme ABC exporter ATP-binding subunit CcmA
MPEAATVEDADPATAWLSGAPGIRAAGLARAYGERPVLRDVTLTLAAGETLAVIGPNGAGKTTLLRILATLLRPGGGELEILGHRVPAESWRLRGRIGYLGHDPSLYRDLTVEENLRFHARLHGVAEADTAIAATLETAGLTRRAGELVRNLSAGLAQRAAACRALLHEPELLLLDEPAAHLDPEAAERLESMLGARAGRTRVTVTHDVDAALGEADRVLALRRDGSVAYEGLAAGLSAGDARAVYGGAL